MAMMKHETTLTGDKVWMVNVKDTESRVKVLNIPEGGVRSVNVGNTGINVVTGDQKLLTSKIKDGSLEDWKQSEELTKFGLIQVDSGLSHHVAITTDNKLVSWGKNGLGQLGRGDISSKKGKKKGVDFTASLIPFFQNTRIHKVSCGDSHTLCLSDEGRVYSWGSNECNQLGLEDTSSLQCTKPRLVENLACIPIAEISAGGHHSFAISTALLVFCWGSNKFGQLGFENSPDKRNHFYGVEFPDACVEKAQSICCGENHTAFLTRDGRVYTCGLGSSGQLGYHTSKNQFTPREIDELNNMQVTGIACGRNYTVVYIQSTKTLHHFGAQNKCVMNLPSEIDHPVLKCGNDVVFIHPPHSTSDDNGSRFISQLFTLDNVMHLMKNAGRDSDQEIRDKLYEGLSQVMIVNQSFRLQNRNQAFSESGHGFDLEASSEFFAEARESSYCGIAEKALKFLVESVSRDTSKTDGLRILLLLPCCLCRKMSHAFSDAIVDPLSKLISGLRRDQMSLLGKWLKSISTHFFKRYVLFFKRHVQIYSNKLFKVMDPSTLMTITCAIESSVTVMDMLNEINEARSTPIPYTNFYIKNLMDKINIPGDFQAMLEDTRSRKQSTFRFCKYPFLFDCASKCILLKSQCQETMQRDPYVISPRRIHKKTKLEVRREFLLQDTRERLSQSKKDLLKQLDVIFLREIDYCGDGIRQEFFQKLIEALLQEDFGACYYEEDSNLQWFVEAGKGRSNLADIRFIGLICGLALYNGVTLHLQFPLALYKNLLDEPTSFEDLFELMPTQYRSCHFLLKYEDEDIEDLCFDFATPFELCPNGADIPVNHKNKKEYVEKLTKYYLTVQKKKEFESFRDGFYTAMPKAMLKSFHAKELQEVLVGNERYDFDAFERIAEYTSGYYKDHYTIQMFWEVFHDMELQDQRNFLSFLTGTSQIPAYGIDRHKITIYPRYGDNPDEMLPQAMTCTNSLMLPMYTNKESLRRMVLFGVNSYFGFGCAPP